MLLDYKKSRRTSRNEVISTIRCGNIANISTSISDNIANIANIRCAGIANIAWQKMALNQPVNPH